MSRHWTCSKFADWLRGTNSLKCGTADEWDEWEDAAKAKSAWRFWLAGDGLRSVEKFIKFVPDQIHSLKYYINNRWITKSHALTAHPRDIKPGQWRDVGDRFLPCLFNELQDYVEEELAWWHLAWNSEDRAKYNAPWWRFGWWTVRLWRCPQAGLDNLEWQRKLVFQKEEVGNRTDLIGKPTPQAIKAQEILDLYIWWTQTYRNRPDPMDASGWSKYCDDCCEELGPGVMAMFKTTKSKALKKQGDAAHKLLQKIEAAYEKEDEQMMIRLIKVRHGLWT